MKSVNLLLIGVLSVLFSSAQDAGPIPELTRKLNQYFSYLPNEKISIVTDKLSYKSGETIWFSVRVTDDNLQLVSPEIQELFVKLYDKKGTAILQDVFRLSNGFASGDLVVPDNLPNDAYFLTTFTSAATDAEETATKVLYIDQEYINQWIVESSLKDSISISGQKNELLLTISDRSGEIQKNNQLRYQFMNGNEILEKGKLKTDEKGKAAISFTLPSKSNGEPFICKISDGKDEWSKEIFLPTNLDQVIIRFFPEGGNLIVGIPTKIGFTAFNRWGIPVDIEGSLVNQENKPITLVKSLSKGLGVFSVLNDGTQKYKLVLSGKTGQNQSFDLMEPKPDGLALSGVKTDAGFISANLTFADKQKHSIVMAITYGSRINWAADMEINGIGRIKIPLETLPQGINLLSVFSTDGQLLAERIVFVDKKQQLKLELIPEKNKLQSGESTIVKVRLTDENNQPIAGNVTVSVSDQFRNETNLQMEDNLMIDSDLETPYSILTAAMKGRKVSPVMMDVYLIANQLKGFKWEKIQNFIPEDKLEETEKAKKFETQLSEIIARRAKKYSFVNTDRQLDKAYLANNPELFEKAPKSTKPNTNSIDYQRNLLASSNNLLEVIDKLKPYKIMNNQVVFNGMENSINYQTGALFVIDGQQLGSDISAIAGISPLSVDHLNVSTNVMDIQRYTALNTIGVIEIFMKRGKAPEPANPKNNVGKYEDGFKIPNVFPSDPANLKLDTRTTLQWIPNQKVDETGQFEFTISAGKVVSDFTINVQGISQNGRMGNGNTVLSVTK